MANKLSVPSGYEQYKKLFIENLKKGLVLDLDESKEKKLFYVS